MIKLNHVGFSFYLTVNVFCSIVVIKIQSLYGALVVSKSALETSAVSFSNFQYY